MDNLEFLKSLKHSLNEAEKEIVRLETLIEEGMKRIKEKFQVNTIEELKKKLEKNLKEKKDLEDKFDEQIKELKEQVEVDDE